MAHRTSRRTGVEYMEEAAKPNSGGSSHDGTGPAQPVRKPAPRRWHMWLFRISVPLLIPLILLAILEGTLRLFSYGHSTEFLVRIDGQNAFTPNERFTCRFSAFKGGSLPEPFVLAATKPPGSVRIFVLGESAAEGAPDPAFGFARVLEVMLRERYPKARFEVVNTAMRGINSHAILPIARSCAKHEPDVFIVLMGNNEVAGFFGPTGVKPGDRLRSLWSIRAGLWAKSMRTGQLAHNWIYGHVDPPASTLQLFLDHQVADGEPRRVDVDRHFAGNLEDICQAGRVPARRCSSAPCR